MQLGGRCTTLNERLQSLYDKLLNYQFENEDSITKAENDCLTKTLNLIQKELNQQYFNGPSLTKLLVENPWEVESVLSELSLQNLFEMAKRGEQIKSMEEVFSKSSFKDATTGRLTKEASGGKR